MTTCNWLVENHVFDEDITPLIAEIKRQGMPVKQVRYIPFENGTYDFYPPNSCVISYGSLQLCSKLTSKQWYPGIWCNLPNYRCTEYYTHYGKYLLNNDYIMMPFNELYRRLPIMLQNDEAVFIRPNDGYKSFTGNLVYKENWEQSVKLMEYSIESSISQSIADIPKSDLVIVAPPLNITKEYRFFAIDRKIITGSLYKENGTKKFSNQYPQQAFDLAQQIIDSTPWQPDPAFSIDICQAYDKYYLLEIGAFSCSGMYHADVTKIVTAASQLAIKEFNDVAV